MMLFTTDKKVFIVLVYCFAALLGLFMAVSTMVVRPPPFAILTSMPTYLRVVLGHGTFQYRYHLADGFEYPLIRD
jgi:hypothetical protein